MSWDYIIVGAGSAGCILANRLSADPNIKGLLIEAGGDDKRFNIYLPGLAFKSMADRRTNSAFIAEPEPSRKDRVEMIPRGKLLGGYSSINATIYVRGNRGDYDHWAELEIDGWSYDDILPYRRRVEGNRDGIPDVYGKDGKVVVSEMRGMPALTHTFVDAMGEIGFPYNPDYNSEPTDGVAIIHATQHMGIRFSAARGYLDPVKRRTNLKIVTGATARRIMLDNKVAFGVEYDVSGKTHTDLCSGEVILSASSINSPKLLMLSGIGR